MCQSKCITPEEKGFKREVFDIPPSKWKVEAGTGWHISRAVQRAVRSWKRKDSYYGYTEEKTMQHYPAPQKGPIYHLGITFPILQPLSANMLHSRWKSYPARSHYGLEVWVHLRLVLLHASGWIPIQTWENQLEPHCIQRLDNHDWVQKRAHPHTAGMKSSWAKHFSPNAAALWH